MISFCFDSMGQYGIGYPNLAKPNLEAHEFDETWPRALPCRLFTYLKIAGIDPNLTLVEHAPHGAWYPVAIAWHDFSCDYFGLMSELVLAKLRCCELRVLFYYHEGDNPERIKHYLDTLCVQHQLPASCYTFISANSAAGQLDNFYYFNDHEWFFSYINRRQGAEIVHDRVRKYDFVALNRVHKWWRLAIMADLRRNGILDRSLWSYNTLNDIGDLPDDNPLIVDEVDGLWDYMTEFMDAGPYWADTNDVDAHNDHRSVNVGLYNDAYCHIVIETLFDADQSNGTFLTEKTFKAIKYGQPFVIFGTAGSLARLRERGYRVFDHAIDNSYDDIKDNTERWLAARRAVQQIKKQDMYTWYKSCLDDVIYNQHHFQSSINEPLHKLVNFLSSKP